MRSLRLAAVVACLALVVTAAPAVSAQAAVSTTGTYHPVASARLLDTRSGVGAPKGQLGAGKTLKLKVAGVGGVPKTGVSAVVINLTATGGTVNGYLSAYPGLVKPNSSSINYQANVARANAATVKVHTDGTITIYNSSGLVSVIVDVMGYYASGAAGPTGTGNEFTTLDPERLIDTRGDGGLLEGDSILTLDLNFDGGDLNSSVAAVAVNVTAVGAEGAGYLTAYDGSDNVPPTSTVNFPNGSAIANMAFVKTSRCPDCGTTPPEVRLGIYNGSRVGVNVLVDLVGLYYHDGTVGLRYTSLPSPIRIKDSRTKPPTPLKVRTTQLVTAPKTVVVPDTEALVTNLTAVAPTNGTYLTAWSATSSTRPSVSNLNTLTNLTAANGAVIGLSESNQLYVYNNAGTTNYLVDVVGRFDVGPGGAAATQRAGTSSLLDHPQVDSSRVRATSAPR